MSGFAGQWSIKQSEKPSDALQRKRPKGGSYDIGLLYG